MQEIDNAGLPNGTGQPDSTRPSAGAESPDNTEAPLCDVQLPDDSEVPTYALDPPDDVDDEDLPDDTGQANNTGQSGPIWKTPNELIDEVTNDHVERLKNQPRSTWPTPEWLGIHVARDMESTFMLQNILRGKENRLPIPRKMLLTQIALFMTILFYIVRISCKSGDPDSDVLAIYMEDGEDQGIYVQSRISFHQLARRFNRNLLNKECDAIIEILRTSKEVLRVTRCTDKDLIAVNNGIFNYKTKELMPFSHKYVFMSKSRVNYNPNAKNVFINNPDDGTKWDVESWINDLSEDSEIVNLIWEILGAIIRPFVSWNKAVFLYAEVGNNGKGTLCVLMQGLCGEESVATLSIEDFSKKFYLAPLLSAVAVISDENDVGVYIDKAANLKAVITGDSVPIERKFENVVKFRFRGLVVECLNGFPRIKDKSDSFYRRQLFVPFTKCFTGRERKYIKDDYLHRPEVLEYVLHRVLHMDDYYELSNPASCQEVLAKYKEFNDPVREFFQEMEHQFTWDLLPFTFLYPLYKSWFSRNCPNGKIQGRNTFIEEVINVSKDSQIWHFVNKDPIRSAGLMNCPEPLILEYELKEWMNPNYSSSSNTKLLATTVPKKEYRGLLRRKDSIGDSDFAEDTDD